MSAIVANCAINLECELTKPVKVQYIGGNMFSMDNAGNTAHVYVYYNGQPQEIVGTISAEVIRADGATVAVTGAMSGNRAYVIFPQAAYAVPGVLSCVIKATEGTTTTTIAAFVTNVYRSSTDTVVDPGTIIPSVSALIAQIDAAIGSIPADYSALLASIAANYSPSKTYPVGAYCWEAGVLKRCIVPIAAAETYTAAHWTDAVIGDDLSALKGAFDINNYLTNNGIFEITQANLVSGVWGYTTPSANAKRLRTNMLIPVKTGTVVEYSTETDQMIYLGEAETETSGSTGFITTGWVSGEGSWVIPKDGFLTFNVKTNPEANISVSDYDSVVKIKTANRREMDMTLECLIVSSEDATSKYNNETGNLPINTYSWIGTSTYNDLPSDAPAGEFGWIITLSPTTRNGTVYAKTQFFILPNPASNIFDVYVRRIQSGALSAWIKNDYVKFSDNPVVQGGVIPDGTDIDDLKTAGVYVLDVTKTYYNNPFGTGGGGTITVLPGSANTVTQIAMRNSSSPRYRNSVLGTFGDWLDLQHVNNFETTVNENSYTINCSPEITTDTNNYLASTGDNTDRTADIQALLNTTGVCRLGPGKFMVSGVDVPRYGYLCGCGDSTTVQLIDQASEGEEEYAYAIKLESFGTIENLKIFGSSSAIDLLETVDANKKPIGKRHGIVFAGTKTDSTTPGQLTYYRSKISNVTITRCTGGGITCTGTGVEVQAHVLIVNCEVFGCGVGMNIPFYSEFHRISNCAFQFNYFGTVDNGGNNNFSCCDFSKNTVGIFIDNSSNQSRNNTHGTFSACSVHHSVSESGVTNEGTALKILGASFGEFFTGLNIGGGAIIIDDSTGIRFVGARFGSYLTITITDSTVTTFDNVTFATTPTFTQSNNTVLKFTDCYLSDGTVYDPMA